VLKRGDETPSTSPDDGTYVVPIDRKWPPTE
jgi:hypothetical protein